MFLGPIPDHLREYVRRNGTPGLFPGPAWVVPPYLDPAGAESLLDRLRRRARRADPADPLFGPDGPRGVLLRGGSGFLAALHEDGAVWVYSSGRAEWSPSGRTAGRSWRSGGRQHTGPSWRTGSPGGRAGHPTVRGAAGRASSRRTRRPGGPAGGCRAARRPSSARAPSASGWAGWTGPAPPDGPAPDAGWDRRTRSVRPTATPTASPPHSSVLTPFGGTTTCRG